ncbi:MAG: NADH-quinone oxidoreductase subunit H, partial [Thiovulaceae bacterium]|nr:NADH-quinone oxidoreductase subunit H [Sulfurimonadaceae bacterium]
TRETNIFTGIFLALLALTELLLAWFYFGGISVNGVAGLITVIQVSTFIIKLFLVNLLFIVVRWTFPRFRYDQIQYLGWHILLPLALVNIFITALVVLL